MNSLKVCHAVISVICLFVASKRERPYSPQSSEGLSFPFRGFVKARKHVAQPGTHGSFYKAQNDHNRQT